ncbi:hypothetical protein ABIA69_000156 [Lysinibacillus parviboronicapiens]|uniref:Uncharacterized protein n=1 Tax=Lysinibacillus parviboronicapiens TaxID=436516 RepID=A0ABV2PDK0_9BACI
MKFDLDGMLSNPKIGLTKSGLFMLIACSSTKTTKGVNIA